ncbi:hypothetical protein [Streptomyces sp. NPDC057794]|uniref:hypothetical protein n=1 Tax=Streptomyces sp. NPDC057794 TaxID=3346251 RepID=UPI0036B30616
MFLPGDPARTATVAFWRPDGTPPPAAPSASTAELTVAVPGGDGVDTVAVPATLMPVGTALPLLTRARVTGRGHRAAVFWGAAAFQALHLVARGLLLPGLSPGDHDAWRTGPLRAQDVEALRRLAAAMPPEAHAVPLPGAGPLRLPDPEQLLRAFLDAVADGLPRSPAAHLVTGGPAYASPEPVHLPAQRAWAADVAAGLDAGVRLSLRIEADGLTEQVGDTTGTGTSPSGGTPPGGGTSTSTGAEPDASDGSDGSDVTFRAVLQVHTDAELADLVALRGGLR